MIEACGLEKGRIFHVTKLAWDASTVTEKIFLGPNEIRRIFELEKEEKTIFSFSDATRILGSKASAWYVIHGLRVKVG